MAGESGKLGGIDGKLLWNDERVLRAGEDGDKLLVWR
jgi:hypothetical protein